MKHQSYIRERGSLGGILKNHEKSGKQKKNHSFWQLQERCEKRLKRENSRQSRKGVHTYKLLRTCSSFFYLPRIIKYKCTYWIWKHNRHVNKNFGPGLTFDFFILITLLIADLCCTFCGDVNHSSWWWQKLHFWWKFIFFRIVLNVAKWQQLGWDVFCTMCQSTKLCTRCSKKDGWTAPDQHIYHQKISKQWNE